MKKKLLTTVLTVGVVLSLVGCGATESTSSESVEETTVAVTEETTEYGTEEISTEEDSTEEAAEEAEVSLRIALYYIKNGYTEKDVYVSLDGAHIKSAGNIIFDITSNAL